MSWNDGIANAFISGACKTFGWQ